LRVSRIAIKNILGLESLEINPGSWTEISGENGSGKTSCLDAIRSALGAGHDATLLKQGATEGEVVLILEDETEIRKRVTEEDSSLTVRHPQFGKISKPATYLKKLADALSLNPIQFLTAPKKDRVDQLLQAIPMQVTADQLGFIPNIAMVGVSLDKHALEVIGTIGKAIYDLRTGLNRAEKEKRATANQMTETLPADAPEGDWSTVYQQKSAELSELRTNAAKRAAGIRSDATIAEQAQKEICAAMEKALDTELAEAIEKLRADTEITRRIAQGKRDSALATIRETRDAALSGGSETYNRDSQALVSEISQAKTMIDQHAKAESTREFIAQLNDEASKLEGQSSELTESLTKLDALKSSLLAKLPIEGLSIQDGDVLVGGIPFDRINTSRKIRISIEDQSRRDNAILHESQ